MLVTPLFGDQRDNAQRVTETGYGDRIDPYNCTPEALLDKVEQLLSNEALKKKVQKLSQQMQASKSTEKAALAIESLAQ